MNETTVLIDAYSQIFRAFFAIRRLTNSKGEPTNALFVFTRLLLELERLYPCRSGAMVFDCGKVGFRLALNPAYKANRPPMPDDLKKQIPQIRRMAEAFGWPLLEEPEYEADDLIAALASASTGPVRIVSSDKDLSQLVDEQIEMLAPAPKNGFEKRGRAEIIAKFAVPPELIVDYLALVGDSADNIPGVPGIGPKSAAALLNEFGPIATWIDDLPKLAESKFAAKLAGQAETLRRNQQLIRLRRDLPPRFSVDPAAALVKKAPDWSQVAAIAGEAELKSILKDLPAAPPVKEEETDLFSSVPAAEEKSATGDVEQGVLF